MGRLSPLIILVAFSQFHLLAQEFPEYSNPEEGFALMRGYAMEGYYGHAKEVGYQLIAEAEDYHDAALYLARIHGWEASFDSAYLVLEKVITRAPELYEAYQTCIDLAYWENNWVKLESCATKALELEPDSTHILEKYRIAQQHRDAQQEHTEVFLHYSYDHFKLPYVRNWHMITAGAVIPVRPGTLIPYVNGGYHTGGNQPSTDLQLNMDGYLTLGKKNYAMAGYGFSPNGEINYLPVHRAAAEIWQVLPKGFALSAGMRYFYWDQHFSFLTFSAEKYAGNYWVSFRNYLFFKEYGASGSYYLSGRRYFATKHDHLTLTLGYGIAPDEPLLVVTDLERLNALSCRIQFSKQIRPALRFNVMAGYAYEEYFDGDYRHRFDARMGCYLRIVK